MIPYHDDVLCHIRILDAGPYTSIKAGDILRVTGWQGPLPYALEFGSVPPDVAWVEHEGAISDDTLRAIVSGVRTFYPPEKSLLASVVTHSGKRLCGIGALAQALLDARGALRRCLPKLKTEKSHGLFGDDEMVALEAEVLACLPGSEPTAGRHGEAGVD